MNKKRILSERVVEFEIAITVYMFILLQSLCLLQYSIAKSREGKAAKIWLILKVLLYN